MYQLFFDHLIFFIYCSPVTRGKQAMIFSNNFEQLAIVEVRRQPCFDKILLERPSAYVNRRRTMNDVSGQIKSILKRTSMPASSSLATLPLMSSASTTATSAPALVAVATASAVTAAHFQYKQQKLYIFKCQNIQ